MSATCAPLHRTTYPAPLQGGRWPLSAPSGQLLKTGTNGRTAGRGGHVLTVRPGLRDAVHLIRCHRSRTPMITESFQTAFEEIKPPDQELRKMVDAIAQTVVVLGPDGELLHPNQALLDYTGLTLEELRSDFHRRFFHPDDAAEIRQRQEGMSRGLPFESERRVRTKEGKYRWWLISYRPLRDGDGRIVRWYATGIDIDDRKRANEQIRNGNLSLRENSDGASMFEEIVGSSP